MNKAYNKRFYELKQVIEDLAATVQVPLALEEDALHVGAVRYAVNFKTNIHAATVLKVIQQCLADGAALLADYVPQDQAGELAKAGVNFVDAVGNCFLAGEGIRVFVTGRKPVAPEPVERALGRAFTKEGLKATFAVMQNAEKLAELTVRALAEMAGVNAATVHYVIKDLEHRGYIRHRRGKKHLLNRKQLLTNWAEAYRIKLRPKIVRGRYAPGCNIMEVELEKNDEAVWGCEMAANKLGVGLWPGFWTIYIWGKPARAMAKAKLRQDRLGTVELLDLWFEPEGVTVPPLLAYAELITSGEGRNLDAALELEDKYNLFGEQGGPEI